MAIWSGTPLFSALIVSTRESVLAKKKSPVRLSAQAINDLPEHIYRHPLNPNSVRNTRSLGDPTGLSQIGVHLVRLKPGRESTELHYHHRSEEFVYVLEGRGVANLGKEEIEITAGDFLGFPALGAPHVLSNPFEEDLLYLCGGTRLVADVCDYPRVQRRLYVSAGEKHYEDLPDKDDTK